MNDIGLRILHYARIRSRRPCGAATETPCPGSGHRGGRTSTPCPLPTSQLRCTSCKAAGL